MSSGGASLRVSLDSKDELPHVRIYLEGELGISAAPVLATRLGELNENLAGPCVIDLEGLDFVDCAGLQEFDRLSDALAAAGSRLIVTRPKASVAQVLELVGGDEWTDPAA